MIRLSSSLVAAAISTLAFCMSGSAHADNLTIKQPGNHPNYGFEAEPHALIGVFNLPGQGEGSAFGVGFRGSIVIVDNGFVKKINNNVAISFGIDWIHYDWCGRNRGNNGCDLAADNDIDLVWLPVTMQWNFWLSENWSVFGEPGLAFRINDHDHYNDDLDLGLAIYAGGRFHFNDDVALAIRLGAPTGLALGVSFFL